MFQTMSFPAGGRQIDAKGNFFRYESCVSAGLDETIRVRADGNDLGTFLPGDYIDLGDLRVTRWEVTPVTPSASGSVRIGNGTVGSSRLTGNVRIIDDSRSRTQAETAFLASALINTAADQTGHLLISNPVGTKKRLVVTQLGFSVVPSAGSAFVSAHVGQSATLTGDTFVRNPASKRVISGASPAASVAEFRSLMSATALPGLTNVQALLTACPVGGMQREVHLTEPITLAPGTCLVLRYGPQAAGATLLCGGWFEFTEEADQ